MNKLANLQYVSQGATFEEQASNIKNALEHGIEWVQLRWKNAQKQELIDLARLVKVWCAEHGATLIINDHVDIAKQLNLDGVHLGLDDMPVEKARAVLGGAKIIGGTANTLEDVIQRTEAGCDYIGLGPYRFTRTKEKLSPILGIEGYQIVMDRLKERGGVYFPQIFAIGGIQLADIEQLINLRIYGVALSSPITLKPSDIKTIKKYYER